MERMSFVKAGQTTEQLDSIQKGESCLQLDLNGQKTKDENNKRSDRNRSQDTGDDQLRLLKIEKENITSEIKLLQEKYEQLQKSLQNLEQDSERKQKDHEQQRKDLRSHITTLTSTNSVLQGEVDMKNRQIETLEKETKTLKKEKNNLTSDLDKHDEENKGLTRNFETLHREKTNLMSDLKKHETEKERLTMRVKAIEGENETLQDDLERLQTESRRELNSLSCNIEELKHKICEKVEEIQHMNEEINELRKPAKTDIVLGVRYGNSIGKTMIEMVTKELSKRLELMIDMTKFSLAVNLFHKGSDTPQGPLVLVCLGISSVGTNIQDTLVGIEVGSDVTVLVLHHTNKENLSSLTPTSLRVTGKEFRKLGAIVDMAFSSESGLYECDLNTAAIAKMAAVLTKF
ncbi:early endosome antigen 1-like [Pecten maximus]|uniref:early endosome antigen 1-like n=1 Tax=Pecten maximus TaxID=6579 RepID=UPI001458EF00|nr:early endosome antigen 1-like [Pecten maximus]